MSIVSVQPDSSSLIAGWQERTNAPVTAIAPQTAYLGFGSNLGDRREMLQRALDAIHGLPETDVIRCSRIYETEPWGGVAQGPFYNCAAEIRTTLLPAQLLTSVKDIEKRMGRVEVQRNGPRIIDIDILLYADLAIDQDGLTIPHPSMAERPFVMVPLREIAPDVVHPRAHETIEELAVRCGSAGVADTALELAVTAGNGA